MVRLLRNLHYPPVWPAIEFQSHNGAIAATALTKNSASSETFQSHNGAIAAIAKLASPIYMRKFQSHNGAIAAVSPNLTDGASTCFNPTMVRLLLGIGWGLERPKVFQSHNGAIAACEQRMLAWLEQEFQSHNGAIAALTNPREVL